MERSTAFRSSTLASAPQERRQSHRVEVLGQLHGHVVALKLPLVVRDIGSGGFSVETPVPFPIDSTHLFRFTTAEGHEVRVKAESVRCLRVSPSDAHPAYITGFEFITSDRETKESIGWLVERLADALTIN